jgi:hypothetical protein
VRSRGEVKERKRMGRERKEYRETRKKDVRR